MQNQKLNKNAKSRREEVGRGKVEGRAESARKGRRERPFPVRQVRGEKEKA